MVNNKESDQLWNEIKNMPINMFGLPNQKVSNHVRHLIGGNPDEVYLKLKSTAVISALEEALDPKKYEVERLEAFTIVRRVTNNSPVVDIEEMLAKARLAEAKKVQAKLEAAKKAKKADKAAKKAAKEARLIQELSVEDVDVVETETVVAPKTGSGPVVKRVG